MKDIIENRKKKSEKYISYVFEGTGGFTSMYQIIYISSYWLYTKCRRTFYNDDHWSIYVSCFFFLSFRRHDNVNIRAVVWKIVFIAFHLFTLPFSELRSNEERSNLYRIVVSPKNVTWLPLFTLFVLRTRSYDRNNDRRIVHSELS